nr:putative ribonuclease H-like domain-containing protein [Tanacetum cinerariifolium]
MKAIFDELEAEVDQNAVNRMCDEIEGKNLLIRNDTLIANCLSKEVFYIATNSELNVSRFSKMHDAHTVVQVRCLVLETKLSKLKDKIQKDDHDVMDGPDFNLVFEIKKLKASIQGKDNAIRKLRTQISQLQETHSEADCTLDFRALDFQIIQLTEKVLVLQEQNELFRVENAKVKQHYKELNNREVHLDYLKRLKESVATIREIIEEARKSVSRTPQQNGVVERRNHTFVKAARTMLIFSKALMFLWAEAVATTYAMVVAAPRPVDPAGSPLSTTIDQDVPSASTSPTN